MAESSIPPGAATRGHHILVCLDLSPASEVALPYALGVARTFGSTVTIVHVLQEASSHGAGAHMTDVLGWEIGRREAGLYLERVQRETAQALGRDVRVMLEQGHPPERIVDLAAELGADLIVLSSHGEGGTSTAQLGSTVQQVLALARCSVFIVHASAPAHDGLPKRLLVPLDGSLRTESVVPTAAALARAYGAALLLVHIVQEPVPSLLLRAPEDLALAQQLASRLELAGNHYMAQLRGRLEHQSAPVRTRVIRHINERQGLLEISQEEHADLIVLSAHGSACDPVHAFGRVATDLLTHSQLPVLVLQDLPEQDLLRPLSVRPSSAPPLRASYAAEVE